MNERRDLQAIVAALATPVLQLRISDNPQGVRKFNEDLAMLTHHQKAAAIM